MKQSEASSAKIIKHWVEDFRRGALNCEAIYENFAALPEGALAALPGAARKAISTAQRELETIKWGVCAESQPREVARVLDDLEAALGPCGGK